MGEHICHTDVTKSCIYNIKNLKIDTMETNPTNVGKTYQEILKGAYFVVCK